MSKKNIKRSYNRILEISEDAKQITMPDSRYYRRNGEYYPSLVVYSSENTFAASLALGKEGSKSFR